MRLCLLELYEFRKYPFVILFYSLKFLKAECLFMRQLGGCYEPQMCLSSKKIKFYKDISTIFGTYLINNRARLSVRIAL